MQKMHCFGILTSWRKRNFWIRGRDIQRIRKYLPKCFLSIDVKSSICTEQIIMAGSLWNLTELQNLNQGKLICDFKEFQKTPISTNIQKYETKLSPQSYRYGKDSARFVRLLQLRSISTAGISCGIAPSYSPLKSY